MMATRNKKEKIQQIYSSSSFSQNFYLRFPKIKMYHTSRTPPPPPGRILVSAPDTFEWHIGTDQYAQDK